LKHGEGLAGDVNDLKVAERQATHLPHLVQHVLSCNTYYTHKKEDQIFLIYSIRKFKRERLHTHIWLMASSYMVKYLRISSYIRKPFLTYDFATDPI
jgi:hypothetical protein